MNIETFFERVTPTSLSGDILLTILLVVILSIYIWKRGVKDIVLFSLAVYLGVFFAGTIPWSIGAVGPFPGALVLFAVFTGAINWILHISPIGTSLAVGKKPLWKNIIFGIAVVGLVLSQVLQYMSLGSGPVRSFVEQSLFSRESFRIIWALAPVLLYPWLSGSRRK